MSSHIQLPDLEKLSNAILKKWGEKAHQYIDYCGLILEVPPKLEFYPCTPKNSLTFASTGGDGVHFSILDQGNAASFNSPVIMTVPMAMEDDLNTVIAENLDEFLGLGYYVGWFGLEQIVYQNPIDFAYFSKPDPEHEEDEIRFIEFVRDLFETEPVKLTTERLEVLRKSYFHLLDIRLDEWG